MEIKVGQWVRNDYGLIAKVEAITTKKKYAWCWSDYGRIDTNDKLEEGHIGYVSTNKKEERYSLTIRFENIEKVADTPQELIQVGDLFGTSLLLPLPVTRVHNDIQLIKSYEDTFDYETITKILTPNSRGGYDLQWEESK